MATQDNQLMPALEPIGLDGFGWKHHRIGQTHIWFRGYIHGRSIDDILNATTKVQKHDAANWLDRLNGHFSIVVKRPDCAFAAVDPVRSYPLIWAADGNSVWVTHDGPAMEQKLGLKAADLDLSMARVVSLAGFTIGNATLYPDVHNIGPGEYLWVDAEGTGQNRYHQWQPWKSKDQGLAKAKSALSELHSKLIDDLVASAAGRQILVPLSAGLDSRFIASGLKAAGYKNVICVAYGLAGNREALVSERIAERLGFKWYFVPYTNSVLREVFLSDQYAQFKRYSDSLTSIHFPQDYYMVQEMKHKGLLEKDCIIVNGQSGDFITGNHIPPTLFASEGSPDERLDNIFDALVQKHFKQWRSLMSPVRIGHIRDLLRQEILRIGGVSNEPHDDHGLYEYCEFQDRQAKYVINGQRTYEFFGYDWRLPLWDRAYLDFWAEAPITAKKQQNLYKTVLLEDNWGGAWKDIPVNPIAIRPFWMPPLRSFLKLAHTPLGRERWHWFEKQYLEYWMAPTCLYAAWPYVEVMRDRRGFSGGIAWHIADYMESKGLNWDASVAASENVDADLADE
ncbi:MAG: asparagine synthase C-terminal domain-containing protein [Pseudomonadota bacterium]